MALMVPSPIWGCDYAWQHPAPQALKDAGFTFACRYLSTDPSKNLTRAEAEALASLGIWCVANWETTSTRADTGGYAGGQADAQQALAEATAAGMPAGRPIYFSVDEPTTVGPHVTAYFDGIKSVLPDAEIGDYGGYAEVKGALDLGLAAWAWQTTAWSNGQWDSRVHIRQTGEQPVIGGVQVDVDVAQQPDFGQWMPGRTPTTTTGELTMDAEVAKAFDDLHNSVQASLIFTGQRFDSVDAREQWLINAMGERFDQLPPVVAAAVAPAITSAVVSAVTQHAPTVDPAIITAAVQQAMASLTMKAVSQ